MLKTKKKEKDKEVLVNYYRPGKNLELDQDSLFFTSLCNTDEATRD